jgi:hypothetical protein
MTITLTWTPGSGATTQTVQYRVAGVTAWTTAINNLPITATEYSISGLHPANVYQFRVFTNCTGNPSSNIVTTPCPEPSIISTTLTEQGCVQYALFVNHPCDAGSFVRVQYIPCGQTTPMEAEESLFGPGVTVCSESIPVVIAGCGYTTPIGTCS